jgi:hypothetical protein
MFASFISGLIVSFVTTSLLTSLLSVSGAAVFFFPHAAKAMMTAKALSHFTKHIKTTGEGTDNSPLFRIFALIITILYELRLNNESKNTDYAWRE